MNGASVRDSFNLLAGAWSRAAYIARRTPTVTNTVLTSPAMYTEQSQIPAGSDVVYERRIVVVNTLRRGASDALKFMHF